MSTNIPLTYIISTCYFTHPGISDGLQNLHYQYMLLYPTWHFRWSSKPTLSVHAIVPTLAFLMVFKPYIISTCYCTHPGIPDGLQTLHYQYMLFYRVHAIVPTLAFLMVFKTYIISTCYCTHPGIPDGLQNLHYQYKLLYPPWPS